MPQKKLNQFYATAICGNDILSSTLYVSGIAILFAGVYAPFVLLFIALVLYFYKSVYQEVVEALPVNGGVYNCLLNATSKTLAAIAGIMIFFSYIATALLSARFGVEYLHTVVDFVPIMWGTFLLLFIFGLLVVAGLRNASKVAGVIFVFHLITLIVFVGAGVYYFFHGPSFFIENIQVTQQLITDRGGIFMALYLAFSASLLGVSGFESSSNFVEEQKAGVFRKTLRNMLLGVAIFNPLIVLIVLNSMPIAGIADVKNFLLADVAHSIGGVLLQYLVAIDAFLVLSGAVLTSYIGVSGLVSRMTYDSCLPSFLGKVNKRGAYPRIIFGFFLFCSLILLLTNGDLLSLAGVYTIAFLSLMTLFGIGGLILRQARTELKRSYKAPLLYISLASLATFFGILGNIRIDIQNLYFFELYFIPAVIIVLGIVYQDLIFSSLIHLTKRFKRVHAYLEKNFKDSKDGRFVVFIHKGKRLHDVLEYISRNETGSNITLIKCKDRNDPQRMEYERIQNLLPILHEIGIFPHFKYELEYIDQEFSPEIIQEVSDRLGIRKNRIMIGSIHDFHNLNYEELGGARIVF